MKRTLSTDPCPRCMTAHQQPACNWDSDKPCPECKQPIGYRWTGQTRDVCWFCERGERRMSEHAWDVVI